MKKINILLCLLLTTSLLVASCKKSKPGTALTELEKLPPITQTRANTFDCLALLCPTELRPQCGRNWKAAVKLTFQRGFRNKPFQD